MDDGYFFDNVVVSNSEAEAAEVREKSWAPKKVIEVRRATKEGGGSQDSLPCETEGMAWLNENAGALGSACT